MNIKISVAVKQSYNVLAEEFVELEVDDLSNPDLMRQALEKTVQLAQEKNMMSHSFDHALRLYLKMREYQIREEADKALRIDKAPDPKIWEVRSKLDETEKKLRMKDCQLDGIIKGINPDYVPLHEKQEPKDL